MVENFVKVQMVEHRKTGLLIATSEDLKGLVVHGRTTDEIDARIPDAIRSLIEAKGGKVSSVYKVDEEPKSNFGYAIARYSAELEAA